MRIVAEMLFRFLLCLYPLSSRVLAEICTVDLCEYTFSISMQESLIYKPPGGPPGYFDVGMDNRGARLVMVNSTYRPTKVFPQFIGQAVKPEEVITLDGVKRNIFTINGQFPGPSLEVMEGAEVIVHVKNMLHDQGVTFHWHGLPQRTNVWMDGVPHLTQCPIGTGHSFTYRFTASPAGTFWYHSHFGYQRTGGLAGSLIIHAALPTMPSSNVFLQDWYHVEGHVYWLTNPLAVPSVAGSGRKLWNYIADGFTPLQVDGSDVSIIRYVSGLINGRGRFNKNEKWPLSEFLMEKGNPHLLRVTSGAGDFAVEFSIDDHQLIVVAVDGLEVMPQVFDSVILYPAERVDIEIRPNQPVGRYWMRSRVLKDDTRQGEELQETLAIVSYKGAAKGIEPRTSPKGCSESTPCKVMNCPFKYFPDSFYKDCVHICDVKKSHSDKQRADLGLNQEEPDLEFFLNLNFNKGANFNAKNFVKPTAPMYQTDSMSTDCDEVCSDDKVCTCTLKLDLPFNKTIQIVISNINPSGKNVQAHPIHTHGHHFAVVKQGFPDYNYGDPPFTISKNPNPNVVCDDDLCRNAQWKGGKQPKLNLHDPPLKDTVVVAASGYTVLRFRSDNPGPWLVHCHFQSHLHQGPMSFLMMEAEDRFPPVPPSMPTCIHNFSLTDQEYIHYRYDAQRALDYGGKFRKVTPVSVKSYPSWYNIPAYLQQGTGDDLQPLITLGVVCGIGAVGGILLSLGVFVTQRKCRRKPRKSK